MIRVVIGLMLAVPLTGCVTGGVATPGQIATVSADTLYTTAVQIATQRVAEGKLSREKFHEMETAAYSALLLVRAAATTSDLVKAQQALATATSQLKGDQ